MCLVENNQLVYHNYGVTTMLVHNLLNVVINKDLKCSAFLGKLNTQFIIIANTYFYCDF